ncbi:hypothetical protein OPT61_g9121 [Boeremia exigua]|uniref:Uncharacterized protein n=1 Tax=Boeremia exigua TaxID=749465 RepID=A0ACC2HVF8_9PLEO|nr:hypothetical protein OPT61_g9121 [Boeremia exigua]
MASFASSAPCVLMRSAARCTRTPTLHHQPFCRARAFAASVSLRKKQEDVTGKAEPHHAPRKAAGKTSSLRSVAVEAQRSRSFVKSRGRTRFIDPDAETKTVTAYCAAETYDIAVAARLVKAQGYELDPFQTGLYPQVIHIQTSDRPSEVKDFQQGDIFIFPSGTVVTWNVREREALKLVQQVLPAAAEGSHLDLLETEDLDYLEDGSRESSEVVGDTIVLGTKPEQSADSTLNETGPAAPEIDTVLAKIAFSSGLARSTKLAVLETLLSNYQHSTREIPNMLAAKHTRSPFTRSFILRKTGELLSIRAQLNLYSELTDSMPDLFWDSRHELGLGGYYDDVGRALDVGVRIKVLNEKIGFAQEIASVLREQLSEKHGLRLEWAIIALIAVEVVLEFWRHYEERRERDDPESTQALLRGYLQRLSHIGPSTPWRLTPRAPPRNLGTGRHQRLPLTPDTQLSCHGTPTMELLDLPPELFQHVIHLLIEDVGPFEAFAVSFTCKTFSTAILQNILRFQSLGNLFCGRRPGAIRLFQTRGGEMMFARYSKPTIGLAATAQALVDKLLEFEQHTDESLREKHLRKIYDAMTAVRNVGPIIKIVTGEKPFEALSDKCLTDLLPAAAAAASNLSTFKSFLRDYDDIVATYPNFGGGILPSAFETAAATGNVEVIQWILGCNRASEKHLLNEYHCFTTDRGYTSRSGPSCSFEKGFGTYAGFAARAAIRRRQQEVAMAMLSYCKEIDKYAASSLMADMVIACMKFGQVELLLRILDHRKSISPRSVSAMKAYNGVAITQNELHCILRYASVSALDQLLQDGWFHLDIMGYHMPLDLAINRQRYDLAQLLLDQGANINILDDRDRPLLQRTLHYHGNDVPRVQFLIENGADIPPVELGRHMPDTSAELCKTATETLSALKPGTKMDRDAWRALWYTMKDDKLKDTWARYGKNRSSDRPKVALSWASIVFNVHSSAGLTDRYRGSCHRQTSKLQANAFLPGPGICWI